MLILSHREELVWQPEKYFDCSFGVEKSKIHSNGEDVISASVQSLIRRLKNFSPDEFDIIITDEAHHAVAKTYRKIFDYFKPRLHVGFTATPNRGDKIKLGGIYNKIIFQRDLKWGIKNGYLSDIRCMTVNIGYNLSDVHKNRDDLNITELSDAVNTPIQNQAVAEAYKKYAVGQTLIFATTVKHAENIAKMIDGAVVVSAETPNRNEIIQKFTNREIPCIVNCMVFTEGTDMPLIETVIIARPTRNVSLYTQMVGRGLRLYDGKKSLLLIDCVGVTGKLDICTASDLFGIDKIPESVNKKKINGKLLTEIEEIINEESAKIPDWKINTKLVKIFETKGKYDTHGINFIMLPNGDMTCSVGAGQAFKVFAEDMAGNSHAVLAYKNKVFREIPTAPMQRILDDIYKILVCDYQESICLWDFHKVQKWGSYPATDSQKNMIRRKMKKSDLQNIDIENLTKYEASVLIGQIFG